MPYDGELASKASHFDILRNPDLRQFLEDCEYLRIPSDDEAEKLVSCFSAAPDLFTRLPIQVIAIDGSRHESSIDERLPSTKIGYVKASATLIPMDEFSGLRTEDRRFVDPFKVAALQQHNSSFIFTLPSANTRWQGKASVRDSFRAAVDHHLSSEMTRWRKSDFHTSLRSTLFLLASLRTGEFSTNDSTSLKLHRCPECENTAIELIDLENQQFCSRCNAELYPSDCLRLWELVTDYQSNVAALTRFMSVVESLLAIHYIRYLMETSLPSLAGTAFFVDGPLAVFGNGAWMHASIMRYLSKVNERLARHGYPPMLIIGLQKTGQVVDHVNLIDRYIPKNSIFAIDDEYRYKYILAEREPASQGFGYEIYYGQDFIYKTSSGRTFVLGLPYPWASKREPGVDFMQEKADLANYPVLPRALSLIRHFESDLYHNAVIPIALAHRYTAISLVPGGHVLDLLSRQMGQRQTQAHV